MFESYYKLNANPFRLSADEQFRFAHKNYLKAWTHLRYALQQGEGFVMVTGRPGSGKTTLIRDILSEIDKSEILAINLVTNQLQAEELLRKVALEFGLPAESYNKATLLTHIEDFITKEYETGRRAVIVIDEAQNLTLNGLEELRLLSNLQTGSHPLFQFFLVGQDELRSLVLSQGMEQIRARLIASCQLDSMDLEQTQGYIEHRLGIVGWNHDPELDDVIYPLIHYLTEGIPRKINHVVSRLLLYGALETKHDFTEEDVWIVAKELFDEERLSIKNGESFTEFKENYTEVTAQTDESADSTGSGESEETAEAVAEEVVGDYRLTDEDTEHGEIATDADDEVLTGIEAEDHTEVAARPVTEEERGREKETDDVAPVAAFFPYGEELVEIDAKDEGAGIVEEQVCSDTIPADQADVPEAELDSSSEETSSAVDAAPPYDDKEEIDVATSQVLDVTRPAEFKVAKSRGDEKTEEILNLPSMQAERRKHEIDEKGGLINTVETFDVDGLFTGTFGKSLRNVFFIVLAGIFFLTLFVIEPGRIERTLEGLAAKWQEITGNEAEDQDPVTVTSENEQQMAENTDHEIQLKTEQLADSSVDASQQTVETSEEPGSTDDDTALTDSDTDRATVTASIAEPEVIDSSLGTDPVEMASKDYIATQSKYQKVEIGEDATESGPAVSASIDMKFQIYFEFDNPNIPEQFKEMLNDLYIVLSLNKKSTMTITGYTDASGDPVYNMNLSIARANAVSRYFTERGIEAKRIIVEGRGPVPKLSSEEHEEFEKRFGNRRVEIILSKGDK